MSLPEIEEQLKAIEAAGRQLHRQPRRKFRLPAGENTLTKMSRVENLIKEYKDGRQPSRTAVVKELIAFHELLKNLWLWGLRKR